MKRELRAMPGVAVLLLISAWLFAELILQRGNTLEANGRWESAKMGLALPVPGAIAFFITRPALYRNRLNLGVWHAYQEILYRDPVALSDIRFDFHLGREDYLSLILGRSPEGFRVVRVSNHPSFPSGCIEADSEERFVSRTVFDAAPLRRGWHHLAVQVEGETFRIALDGEPWQTCEMKALPEGRFGFRGCRAKRTAVDDVSVGLKGEDRRIREGFSNRRHAGRLIASSLWLVGAALLVLAAVYRLVNGSYERIAFALLAGALVVSVVGGLLLGVDHFYLAKLHPERVNFRSYESGFETEAEVLARIARSVTPRPSGSALRVLFLGTSQTWGSGAATPDDRWVDRLHAAWRIAEPDRELEFINTGIPGHESARLVELYETRWVALEPDAVVANLAANDHDPVVLARSLERLVEENRARGIHTAFVVEPNTIENAKSLRKLERRHRAVRDVGERLGVPVIDMQEWLARHHDRGFLWWDRVHLTSVGQALFAAKMFAERELLLPPDAKR